MATAEFNPVTVTAETIRKLQKEKRHLALALYLAYAEITQWQ